MGAVMNISIIDGSNYFKGLLLLIRKDRKLADSEISMMQRIGKSLGFEKEFYENAIRDILVNDYIVESVPVFGSTDLAAKFVRDGLALAFSDNECHPSEEAWLRSVAEKNGLDERWFLNAKELAEQRHHLPPTMEVDNITVQYF